ncbi:MAG: TonB-dependent receptor [Xanthomonadales bacterium]|nr:TonB-dependent receptor [Xanthomonadales bacterium]
MKSPILYLLTLISIPGILLQTAWADDAQEDAFPLPEIAVTAKRIQVPRVMVVRELSEDDFDAWNAQTAGDALTFAPGVNVQVGGSSGDSRAWVRGFRDRDVLVLYDGIPIASGFEGTIDLNEISLAAVSEIRVLKSAPSVIYGTNGMGGVIDVQPRPEQSGKHFSGRLEAGSDDRRLVQAAAGGGNGNLGYTLSASHQEADDYSLSGDYAGELNQPPGKRLNSDFERNNVFMRFDAQESFLGHTSLFVNLSGAEKGLPVETGVEDPDYERLTESKRRTVGFSNHFRNIPLSLKLYYNAYDSELTAYTDDGFREIDGVERAQDHSWGGKFYSTIETSDRNSLVMTVGAQADVFQAEGELENGNKAELTTYVLAAEDQFSMTNRLSLAAGLIYTYFDQTRLDQSSSALNPQLALAWRSSSKLSFHASAAQRTRFPKLRELYRRKYGNPDLEEQTANNFELGMQYQAGAGISADFALFRSDVDDLIERLDRRSLYQNLERVTFQGIETAAGGWLAENTYARLAYTWVDAEEKLETGDKQQLRSRPEHTLMAEYRYRFPRKFLFTFNAIYVTGLYDLDPEGVYTRLPSYLVGNVRLTKTFGQHAAAYLAVSNLLDEDYEHRIGNPREGRAIMLGLNFEF